MEKMKAQMLIFCLDSKTINLSDRPIKGIVGQTTSECVFVCVGGGGVGGQQQQEQQNVTQTRNSFDRPV